MQAIVLDTSACLLPFLDQTDVRAELERLTGAYKIVLPRSVVDELQMLAAEGGARGRAAQGAIRMFAKAEHAPTDLPGDDGVLDVARRLKAVVVSNDKRLRKECGRSGLRCIGTRGDRRMDWLA